MAVALLCLMVRFAAAQPEELTGDFGKLSAKERARIAKQEDADAREDAAYQQVMGEAELLFRSASYDEALVKYKEARTMRPYNVYPKVKIQDLQALIAKREAEAKAMAEEVPVPEPDPPVIPAPVVQEPVPVVEPAQAEPEKPAPVEQKPLPTPVVVAPKPKEQPSAPLPIPIKPVKPYTPPAAEEPHEAVQEGERIYKEGRSVVVERRIQREGRITIYRKVTHPWGEVNYFRDGTPISERAFTTDLQ